ncbi:MAG: D-sedoheptulose 7-phosphate isomerase [Flavobacteriales bacterium]|jgi:D-sedoheptulose 7-phosphate isomerase|nr:D-sedoheptulose 7-phosphate isomerase [Flavobacteriales bacterium]|tara:strand:+ start:2474 stop:3049 length:576 start_codon:yes stop_codon:yes gene_type:complete
MQESIYKIIKESSDNFNNISNDKNITLEIEKIIDLIVNAFLNDNKLLLCGNGGSASDAQHIAAELSGRFLKERKPLYAEALNVNTSFLTAVANDYGFEKTYARMIEASGKRGDILLALSTSGNSPNVLLAIQKANELGMKTIGLTGSDGGEMNGICNILIKIPSSNTARIQEAHILTGHIICQLVEEKMFD